MPNTPTQPGKLPATLVLDGVGSLSGELSSLLDGRLQLDAVHSLDNPEATDTLYLEPGTLAILSIANVSDMDNAPGDATVRIAAQHNNTLTLEFDPADEELATRYREVIASDWAPAMSTIFRSETTQGSTEGAGAHPETKAAPRVAQANTASATPPESEVVALAATAEYVVILDTLKKRSLEQLKVILKPFFADLADYLLDLSTRIRQPELGKNPHYDAWVLVRRNSAQITQNLLQKIVAYYQELTPEHGDDLLWRYNIGSAEELDLIDLQEFEDFLAIDRMVSLGEDLHKIALEALTIRLATLIDANPDTVRLPIHVRQLCRAFQRALIASQIPHEVLPHSFDFFAKYFIRRLDGYYDPLNKMLSENAVCPNVEIEIQNGAILLSRNVPPARVVRNTIPPSNPSQSQHRSGEQPGATSLHTSHSKPANPANPANLYHSVINALNFKREAEGLSDGKRLASGAMLSGTWDGRTVASTALDQDKLADAQSIARALSALQGDSQVREDVQQSTSLRAYLASNKDHIGGLQNTSGLTTDSLNQLDMVDNLFGTIKSQLDVSSELKPTLGNLQIPLTKMALLDPRFFVDRTHTARTVVNKLSQLATSANFPNRALEKHINNIVDDIIREYETDDAIFDTALARINKLVTQQERALARNIERVVRTQEGRQRLGEARRAVDKAVRARIHPPSAPKVLVDLVESGWRDLLVLTHVREGPDSPAWAEQVRTLDLLCLWLDERLQGDIDDDLSVQRSMEAEPFIELIGHQISSALPTNIAHEEVLEQLRGILAGTVEIESTQVAQELANLESEPAQVRARIEDLPRLRRWVNRVEQLEAGSWLTYRDKDGSKKRMQLAWISPMKDRYIFVNDRGQKVADLSTIKLARQLSQGVQPPPPADKLSVVDQSMYHTLEHVQKSLSFTRNHDLVTQLINRKTFIEQVKRALRHSQTRHSQHAVLYLNIDQFNLVNDVYDRISGDQVLLEFAKLLSQLHGKKSSSARMDADEFAVLLLDHSMEDALRVAERIRHDIEKSSLDIEGENVSFTVSIGVVAIVEHSPGVDQLIAAARSAMQHAKQEGRNQVMQFEEAQDSVEDFKLEKTRKRRDLEAALASERFILRAQPIVQTAVSDRDSTSMHYELLLGLVNKDGSVSSPEEFIQSAERYGFMTLVDRWVVQETFTWISQLMDEQKVLPSLAINLSGASVTDDSFMEYLLEKISEFGVGTSRLCFEITETGTISNLVKAADFVRAFRNIGCKFSIDDFGTGLASHNYLRELPVDYVKIDGSFITGIHKSRTDYAMARSINDLAHFLGQETIAESVENDEIIAKLEEIGVDYLQGWGIGMPKPLVEVTADLSNLEK